MSEAPPVWGVYYDKDRKTKEASHAKLSLPVAKHLFLCSEPFGFVFCIQPFFFFFDILQQAFFYLPVSPFLYFFKWGQPTKAVPKVQGGTACRQALCGCSQHHPICSPISFQSWLERDVGSQCCQVVLQSHSASSPVQAKHIMGIHIKARISIGWVWLAGVPY